jgi:hypothetical protein
MLEGPALQGGKMLRRRIRILSLLSPLVLAIAACDLSSARAVEPTRLLAGDSLPRTDEWDELEDPGSGAPANYLIYSNAAVIIPDGFVAFGEAMSGTTGGVAFKRAWGGGTLQSGTGMLTFGLNCWTILSSECVTRSPTYGVDCYARYNRITVASYHFAKWLTVQSPVVPYSHEDSCGGSPPSGGDGYLATGGSYDEEGCLFCQQYFWFEDGVAVDGVQ